MTAFAKRDWHGLDADRPTHMKGTQPVRQGITRGVPFDHGRHILQTTATR